MTQQISFIGGGNMAVSLIGGLIADGYPAADIHVAEPDNAKRQQLQQQYNVQTHASNLQATASADVVVLAVKPQIMQGICRELASTTQQNKPLVISIAAGLRSVDIERWLGGDVSMVRCMPNTPALLRAGATGMFANSQVSDEQHQLADKILKTAGITTWVVDEKLLDAVTAVSGSGPAYYFLFMEAMQKSAEQLGLDSKQAKELTLQTALGAARMAMESDDDPATLRTKVTSKGGTTEQAINTFEAHQFSDIIHQAMNAAYQRANELADLLGKDE